MRDRRLAAPAAFRADMFMKPPRQRRLGLVAQPQPSQLDHDRA